MSTVRIHHGVEGPNPVRAEGGTVTLDGWCFEEGASAPPPVRLAVDGSVIEPTRRVRRPDIALRFARVGPCIDPGFRFEASLSAGIHEARLDARESSGDWRTLRRFSIASDDPELRPRPTSASSAAPGLRRHPERHVDFPAPGEAERLNLLFVMPGDFASNQALHVISLTRHLSSAGHCCIVASNPPIDTLDAHVPVPFGALTLQQVRERVPVFPDGRGPDIVHAWTPRENVRRTCEPVLAASDAVLVVHLEDNEWQILSSTLGRTIEELRSLTPAEADAILPWNLSHPGVAERFIARASCATLVVDRLAAFLPNGMPSLTIWPSANTRFFFPRPKPLAFREALGLGPDHTILFYPGNVHAANVGEMRALYEAVALLNERGVPASLIRTGGNHCPFPGDLGPRIRGCVLELGHVNDHATIPELMAVADILVQPGEPGPFNDYRFPSKLPEFFSIGRPVILPRANLGAALEHGRDAFLLDRSDARGIADAILAVRADPQLAERLARGATAFAGANFSWARNAARLSSFYHEALARSRER